MVPVLPSSRYQPDIPESSAPWLKAEEDKTGVCKQLAIFSFARVQEQLSQQAQENIGGNLKFQVAEPVTRMHVFLEYFPSRVIMIQDFK